jgi:hypothetical protein
MGAPNSFGVAGGQRNGHGDTQEEQRSKEEGSLEEEICPEEEGGFSNGADPRDCDAERRGEDRGFRNRLQRHPECIAVFDIQSPALGVRSGSSETRSPRSRGRAPLERGERRRGLRGRTAISN